MMDSGFQPKFLICVECGEEFVFTVNAQEYFAGRGYTENPKRCKHCHMKHKREKRNGHSDITIIEKIEQDDIGRLYFD